MDGEIRGGSVTGGRRMRETTHEVREAGGARFSPRSFGRAFWDGVERETEAADPADLLEFLSPREAPPARPGFERVLAMHLRELLRLRRQH